MSHNLQAVSTSLHFPFKQVNTGTVLKELRNLKRSKSPGLDDIPPSLLKDAESCLAEPLTYLINMSLHTGQVANEWKQAKVLPLFRSGNATKLDNYRPISILPILSKVLERVVHMQFTDYLESSRLLYKYQFVFQRQHSTNLAVMFFTDSVPRAMDNGQFTGSVFINLRKAFDMVDHSCLLKKLEMIGAHSQEHVWFTDYLFNHHQTIVYENCKSESFPFFYGVSQGSILGPLLFLVHINSLHKCLENPDVLLYANDAVIYTSHKEKRTLELMLTQDMSNTANWLDKNKLIINLKKGKTESMLFGTGQCLGKENVNPFSVKTRDQSICYSTSYKYLGITLDPVLTLSHHLLNTYRKASGRLCLLQRIRPLLTIQSAKSMYQSSSMILPVFSYCNTITLDLSESFTQNYETLRIEQIE